MRINRYQGDKARRKKGQAPNREGFERKVKKKKKLVSIVTVILMVLGLMIPAFAGAEQVITTTSILEDGTKLVRIEHLLPLGDRKIGRLSVRNENGAQYVEEYKLMPCEEWEDEDGYIYHRDNINRTVMVYMCNGLLVAEYSF